MRRPSIGRASLLAVALAAGFAGVAAAQKEGVAVGARAPAVTIADLDGRPVDLGQYIGRKPVLLEFWATWCEQCEALLPKLRAAKRAVGDEVEFFGINVAVNQPPARVRRYVEAESPPFRTLYDADGVSVRAYAVPATSYVVIVDRDGRVAYTGTGGAQDLEPVLRRVAGPRATQRTTQEGTETR